MRAYRLDWLRATYSGRGVSERDPFARFYESEISVGQVCGIPGGQSDMTAEGTDKRVSNGGKICAMADCRRLSAAALENQQLCLEHFFMRCYQALERYDRCRDRTRWVQDTERAQLRRFLEECSAQALNVSLRQENLNNLERGRLLDVLLWAGELSECARAPKGRLDARLEHGGSSGEGGSARASGS
jgi:hypothetical protein